MLHGPYVTRRLAELDGREQLLRYVATYGDDEDDGFSWSSAKQSIQSSIDSLPLVGSGGNLRNEGKVLVGPGIFQPPSGIRYASNLMIQGSGGNTAGTTPVEGGGGTIIMAPANLNQNLFDIREGFTDWAHYFVLRDLVIHGNKANQAGVGVARFLDDDVSNTLAFDAAGKTITRQSGSWVSDGYLAGMKVRVHGTVENNGVLTISTGGVAAAVLTVDETIVDESALNGAGLHASPFDCIRIAKPGFGTTFDNVFFRDAAGWGIDVQITATNLLIHNCCGTSCQQAWLHTDFVPTANLVNISISGQCQIDESGPAPLFFESRSNGGANIVNIQSLELEAFLEPNHMAAIRYHRVAGSNALRFNIGSVNAWRSGSLGAGTAGIHEMAGGSAMWSIDQAFVDNYAADFVSDAIPLTIAPPISGNPIFVGQQFGGDGVIWVRGTAVWGGDANPEGNITAPPGSIYLRGDGGPGFTRYRKESGTGNTGWVDEIRLFTTAQLEDVGHAANTTSKWESKMVWNGTTNRPLWAVNGNANGAWLDATGATVHTPI